MLKENDNHKFDIKLHYNYVLRNILINKQNYFKSKKNTYNISKINKMLLSINQNQVMSLDNPEIYQYIYLFWFFFGKRLYYSKVKSFFNLGEWYYNYSIQLIVSGKCLYNVINFMIYEWLPNIIDFRLLNKGIYSEKNKSYYIRIGDFSRLSELNGNLRLMYTKDYLNFKFFFQGGDLSSSYALLKEFKLF